MPDFPRVLLAACLALLAGAAGARADWVLTSSNPPAATTLSKDGTWRMLVGCAGTGAIDLRFILNPSGGWNGNAAASFKLDGVAVPLVPDGFGANGIALTESGRQWGISGALLNRMMAAKSFVIDGPAASKVPLARRSFGLNGASEAMSAATASCQGTPR